MRHRLLESVAVWHGYYCSQIVTCFDLNHVTQYLESDIYLVNRHTMSTFHTHKTNIPLLMSLCVTIMQKLPVLTQQDAKYFLKIKQNTNKTQM
ncbi:hypothetical protein FKM82_019983 [Ascaphus truei]